MPTPRAEGPGELAPSSGDPLPGMSSSKDGPRDGPRRGDSRLKLGPRDGPRRGDSRLKLGPLEGVERKRASRSWRRFEEELRRMGAACGRSYT